MKIEFKNDIFLSYNHGIKNKVIELYDFLTSKGYTVWMDEKYMTAGDNLRKEITTAIRESRIIICCITLAYSNSERTIPHKRNVQGRNFFFDFL